MWSPPATFITTEAPTTRLICARQRARPVYAAEDGTVDWVQSWDGHTTTGTQSYGNAVRIRHADYNGKTLQTRYAHLSQTVVNPGDQVQAGQLIGYSGDSGNVTAPHLHFEVIWDGVRRNPLVWLDDDFTTASARVYTYGPGEGPVARPEEPAAAEQTLVIGPMSEGDAAYFAQFAAWLGLGNRFSAEQAAAAACGWFWGRFRPATPPWPSCSPHTWGLPQ